MIIDNAKNQLEKKRNQFFADHNFDIGALSEKEKIDLLNLYDVSIENITALSPAQQWFFTEQATVSPHFHIQTLFRVSGIIVPELLMTRMRQLIKEKPILRTVFYSGEQRTLAVALKRSSPEIISRDLTDKTTEQIEQSLENFLEADRRRGFNLETDILMRIGIYKTDVRDYAVLISQLHIISDHWDISDLLNPLFDTEDVVIAAKGRKDIQLLKPKDPNAPSRLQQTTKDKTPALRYWKNLLSNFPDLPQIPGSCNAYQQYEQVITSYEIDSPLIEKYCELTNNTKTNFAILLQTAWALMLQSFNRTTDTCICSIFSGRKKMPNTIIDTANLLNMMPIRLKNECSSAISEIIKKQYLQILVSEPMNYCDEKDLRLLSAKEDDLFNHYLDFHNFFSPVATYHETKPAFGIVPLFVNAFDQQNKNLGVYFRLSGKKLKVEFVYNRHAFPVQGIEFLKNYFSTVVHRTLENMDNSLGELRQELHQKYVNTNEDFDIQHYRYEEIISFINKQDLFSGLSEKAIDSLATISHMENYSENDIIIVEGTKQDYIFIIMQGNIEISRTLLNGWQGSLGILGKNKVINLGGILAQPCSIRAEALQDETVVLKIPIEFVCSLLESKKIMMYLWMAKMNDEINKYQKLWINE